MIEAEVPDTPQVDPALLADLPGQYLCRAREARGLSIGDIARTLKFSERQIEALERDEYQLLPGVTFIRGFIRSYARLVKLDAAPLLAMLDAGAPLAAVEVVAPGNMGDAIPQALLRRHSRKIAFGTVFLLVLIAIAYVWNPGFFNNEDLAQSMPRKASRAPEHAPSAELTASAPPIVATTTAVSGNQLVFDFDEKSWIEVKDATNAIVLTGEFPAHTHQVIAGQPPYQLWVGNASGVRVTRDDHPVDLQPSTREGVARLTLD